MSNIYICENGVQVGISEGRCQITQNKNLINSIPVKDIDGITILGRAQLTTQLVEYCLTNGVNVSYFSKGGKYFGKLESSQHVNAYRQRKQCELYNTDFRLMLAKKIICSKIHNQYVVLKRYERYGDIQCKAEKKMIKIAEIKSRNAQTISELMGYEGLGAKMYFQGLGKCIDSEFYFEKRSRRPPLDEFNSMLSLGYSILIREIQCAIENHGMNAYLGFIHSDSQNVPTLACDLIEEWRAVIVDATVASIVNKHIIRKEHFERQEGQDGIFLTKDGCRIFLDNMERKLSTKIQYLNYLEYPVDFRHTIDAQINQLIKAIEENNVNLYTPLWIR